MAAALGKQETRPVGVVVLDANPILGEAMCRHFGATKIFGRQDAVSLTWDRAWELPDLHPTVLVLDPAEQPQGLEAFVTGLRSSIPGLQLVAYASDPSPELARLCLNLGFRAFVPKSADSGQLVTAVTVVANGGMYVDRQFAESLMPLPKPADGGPLPLSPREEAILRRIALGLSHKQIAAEQGLSHKTVDTYRARGMRKLELADRGALVRYAMKQGWLD